jgi:hypothetical protein
MQAVKIDPTEEDLSVLVGSDDIDPYIEPPSTKASCTGCTCFQRAET